MTGRQSGIGWKAALAACMVVAATGSAFSTEASYTCSDGTHVKAVFSPPDQSPGSVVLQIAGAGEVTLPQAVSADGGRYANDQMEFWDKGATATFSRDGNSVTCHRK